MFVLIGMCLLVICLTISSFVIAGGLFTIMTVFKGRYLNRYYMISKKKDGLFELHCNLFYGFCFAMPAMYFRLRDDAIQKFKRNHPDSVLYAFTYSLQPFYDNQGYMGIPVIQTRGKRFVGLMISYLLILRNFANYRRRNDKEWQLCHLARRINRAELKRYTIEGR